VPVTYCVTATCSNGSTSSASVVFTAQDLVPPIAVCGIGLGVALDPDCTFQVTPEFVNAGSTDNCQIQSMSVSPTVITGCTTTTVTLTVTDWCNNTSTCTMGIQTGEAEPPVMTCPPNTTVIGVLGPLGCTAVYQPVQPVAFDNCSPPVSLSNDAPPVLIAGQNIITWEAADNCNNVSTCSVVITVSCDNCACGSFSNTCLRSGTRIACTPVFCGAAAINLVCPASGFGYDFTGQFDCQGLCTTPLISWQFSGPSGTFTGTTIPWPFFCIDLLPTYFGTAGLYTLTLQGHCDGLDCPPCVYQFNIDCGNVCSCDPTVLQSNVEAGFASVLSNNSCKGCFSATALTDCDAVEWFINGLSKGSSIGWETFCYMFPSAGTYAVKMLVTRRNSDGSVCGVFSYTRNVAVTCFTSSDCNNSVLSNSRFSEGSPIAGNLNAGGFCEGWKAISGQPFLFEGQPAETLDAWALYITGNLDSSDVVSSAMPICVEGSGMVSLRVAGDPIPGMDVKIGRTPPGSTMFVVLYQGNTLDIHNCENCYKLVSVDGLLPLDSGEWVQIEAPFNLNNWATMDHCGDGEAGVPVRIAVYITSPFGNNQGGLQNGYRAELDNLCLEGTLVSVKNPTERLSLSILPNPNPGSFSVELPEAAMPGMRFRVVSLTGQVLRELSTQPGSNTQTVHVDDLPAGLYFLQVVSEGKVLAEEKFVKQ
jgi:hypothetical protein